MRKKKKSITIAMADEEADFDGIVYGLHKMPRVRRVLELLTAPTGLRKTTELQAIIGRYRMVMRLRPDGIVVYLPAPGTDMHDRNECAAVRLLLSLDPKRMRRCEWHKCNRWFYAASRTDQRFCKRGTCRQNSHQYDPVKYAAKLNRQREQYHKDREDEAKAKEAVGYVPPARKK